MKPYMTVAVILVASLIMSASPVRADIGPLDTLKAPIDRVIEILNDPGYSDPAKREAQREAIWKTIEGMFDFDEMSKRTLAQDWRTFSPKEQKAFSEVFARFLGNTYMDKIQGEYHNEKIIYISEEIAREKYALAKTKIVRDTLEIPVDYVMLLADGRWRVYDVRVEGVSLVKNYRSQFQKILTKESPAQLIERLQSKLSSQR